MISTVLFDYDGVMTPDKSGSYSICKYVSSAANIDYELFSNEYKKYNDQLLYGKTTHEDIWNKICEGIGVSISIKYLYDSFKNTPINEKMFELVKKIKKNYKTGLITDNKKDRMDAVINYQKLYDIFDVITISAVIGSGKDKEEIFVDSVKNLNVSFTDCIFIDNQEKNLIIPKKLGIKTIFYDHKLNNIKTIYGELKMLGVKL